MVMLWRASITGCAGIRSMTSAAIIRVAVGIGMDGAANIGGSICGRSQYGSNAGLTEYLQNTPERRIEQKTRNSTENRKPKRGEKNMNTDKKNVYEIVTEKILNQLEQGEIPWRNPYQSCDMPKNAVTGKYYRGINPWLLICNRYNQSRWLTYKQAEESGGHVKKNEKASMVTFWKKLDGKKKGEELEGVKEKSAFVLRYYYVFNVAQCDGLPQEYYDKHEERQNNPIEQAEMIVNRMPNKPEIDEGNYACACYVPSKDKVVIQRKELFTDSQLYYSVLFHELTHATGHESRLNREQDDLAAMGGGRNRYAKEELIAEMGAGYLCALAGIATRETEQDMTSYLQGWLKALKNDKTLIVKAAGLAQKAADYITGTTFE